MTTSDAFERGDTFVASQAMPFASLEAIIFDSLLGKLLVRSS